MESILWRLEKIKEKVWGIAIYYYYTHIKFLFYIVDIFRAKELFFLLTGHVFIAVTVLL